MTTIAGRAPAAELHRDIELWLAVHMLGEWSRLPRLDLGDYWTLLGDAGRARFTERVVEASRRDRFRLGPEIPQAGDHPSPG
ncbi:MAG: hypothetical protein ACJ72W_15625 [Actinoallomurus sp.]